MMKSAKLAAGVLWVATAAFGQEPFIRWTFDGASATNCGSGGDAYDAIVSGAVVFTNGIDGGGLRFLGGSEGYAAAAHTFGDAGTVAFWYKPSRFFNYNAVFDNSVDPNRWEMWVQSDAAVRFRLASGQGDITHNNLNSLHNGTNAWYHFALTWDRSAATNHVRFYVNGVERQTANITSWVTPGQTVYFGGHSGNNPGEGVLDEVRVYTNALTAQQVQSIHAETATQAPVVRITLDGAVTNAGTGAPRYDAALRGDPAPVWTNGWNNRGQALALAGTNDFVSLPYRMPASGSIALWYYAPGLWYNYNSVFDNSGDANDYECWIDKDGGLYFRPTRSTPAAGYNLGGNSNRWYHIVGTWDALSSNVVLYVNGVERGRTAITNGSAWPVAGTNVFIGGGNAGNSSGTGIASDFQIFETPLSSNRVAQLYSEFGSRGGLVAYVPFDGTAVDVANSNAVVVGGAPTYVKTQGGFLKGLSCRGGSTGDNASISNALGASVGTIALWYYARGPWYNYQTVFDNTVFQEHWESWIYSDGRLACRVSNLADGGMVVYDLDNLRGPNNWYHIAYVWDRAARQTRLYVDGVLRQSVALTDAGWVNPNSTLNLAGGHAGNTKGNGIWDEVRVYDRALTAEEIAELTVIPPPPPPSGTIIMVL